MSVFFYFHKILIILLNTNSFNSIVKLYTQTRCTIIIRLTDGSSTMKKLVLAALLTSFAFRRRCRRKSALASPATYPPFESMDAERQIVGFDIDLAKSYYQTNAGRMYLYQPRV